MEKVFSNIPKTTIYKKTGIQFQSFNTLYQLYEENKNVLKQTQKILLIPDYLTYLLTGELMNEITNLSTTQLVNIHHSNIDEDFLKLIGIEATKFPKRVEPGTVIGKLKKELIEEYDLPFCSVIAVGTHDTASAVVGVPATSKKWAYLSSGTWSLLGVELNKEIITKESYEANYTNERGVYDTFRFLKNIPGMWFIQEIARNYDYKYSYEEMAEEASKVKPLHQVINLYDARFTKPQNMIKEIQNYCIERNLIVPTSVGELSMAIYSNLANTYAKEVEELEKISKREIENLHIVGGGSNIEILNQLTANYTKKRVITGPSEATALGNIMMQLITTGYFNTLKKAREWLAAQIDTKIYLPR